MTGDHYWFIYNWQVIIIDVFIIGDHYALKMRFIDHIYDDMVVDDMTLKIILPEGSK